MRVMVFVKATEPSEAAVMPTQDAFDAMGRFNDELEAAGVLVMAEGLRPSRDAVRVAFDGDTRTVEPGPFTPAHELVAGFWIWEVASMAEAIEWARRCPNPMPVPSKLEIRPFYGPLDIG